MHIESPARMRETALPSVGSEELAEGLMLVRASTLKMIRLQLAMERQDRRVALETVDALVALDRRMQDYLADVPAADEQLLFRNALEADRAMLNREKLTLAGEVVRREPAAIEAEVPTQTGVDEELSWEGFEFTPDEEQRPHRAILWFAIVLACLAVAAGMAWALLGPEWLGTLQSGAFQ